MSWLEEQSVLTDDDFKDFVDINIKEEKFLVKLIKETQHVRKRSKA